MKKRDKYIKLVEWSEEDQCYVGSVPGFIGPCCHGKNEEKVYHQLIEILDEWIEIHEKDGIPLPEETADKQYSGRFVLRVGTDLHRILAISALKSHTSLNNFCKELLSESVK